MSPRSNGKPAIGQWSTSKKDVTSISYKLEPAIWSCDMRQRIPCFDMCQLIITWMSNIREVHSKRRLHVSVKLLFGLWPPCCVTPLSPSCIRAHEPITASHNNHEKINSWVSFCLSPYRYAALLGSPLGRQSSAMTI